MWSHSQSDIISFLAKSDIVAVSLDIINYTKRRWGINNMAHRADEIETLHAKLYSADKKVPKFICRISSEVGKCCLFSLNYWKDFFLNVLPIRIGTCQLAPLSPRSARISLSLRRPLCSVIFLVKHFLFKRHQLQQIGFIVLWAPSQKPKPAHITIFYVYKQCTACSNGLDLQCAKKSKNSERKKIK